MSETIKNNKRVNASKIFIVTQTAIVAIALLSFVFIYPRVTLSINGNTVNFNPVNARTIILSDNPDFMDSRYVDLDSNVTFNLKPGRYYWKASNGVVSGISKEFIIESEVALKIEEINNEKELINVGNVRVNVSRTKEGLFVGNIILEPEEGENIDGGEYVGRQNGL